ncbi:hypothetical protein IAI10_12900 [Clostridium sp. 19966]|uniref:PP2C family protein-serine/threonine phosphatase n=1 Tax=Clostridium sp. 19966 TaxID=2768166 RepID=UPI0028E06175|nr:PP2C family serine/threonine-protein phosphatase [Clostridium sp. 19966]MDT8717563.1 hypothetical protein [Clostridium sp. 19966]
MECYANLLVGTSGVSKDACYISDNKDIFVLCEGGSSFYTEKPASEYCINAFKKANYGASGLQPFDYLKQCINVANNTLIEKSQEEEKLFTSSILAVVLEKNQLYISGVGNTESFLIKGSTIKRFLKTKKKYHNEIEYGILTEEDAVKAVGALPERLKPYFDNYLPEVVPDIASNKDTVQLGDILLLCSNLVYSLINQQEMLDIMRNNALEAAVEKVFSLVAARYPKYWIGDRTFVAIKF